MNISDFITHNISSSAPIILDGAMGTELQKRGADTGLPLWSATALQSKPELVFQIHCDYVAAGASIITTNTFRTTTRTFKRAELEDGSRELTLSACNLARRAIATSKGRPVFVAGSIAPLEECYQPELVPADCELAREHQKLAQDLKDGGVDLILCETMNCAREAFAALHAGGQTGLPVAISFVCNAQGNLLSGEPLSDVIPALEKFNPIFIGINCISIECANQVVPMMRRLTQRPLCVYANGDGKPDDTNGWEFLGKDGEAGYIHAAIGWLEHGVNIIGGCCGTSPNYIQKLTGTLA